MTIVLASTSETRAALLRAAGVTVTIHPPRIDEEAIKSALMRDAVGPRDIADALAEAKARKVSAKCPGDLVLGCDQVLDLDGEVLSKPADRTGAASQLARLSGRSHELHSAIVAYEDGAPVWRHVGTVRLSMRPLSGEYLSGYLDRHWDTVRHSPGAYRIEGESARFFTSIDGAYFDVLGLPLIPLLSWLVARGYLQV